MWNVWRRYDDDYGWLIVEKFTPSYCSLLFTEVNADEYFY